MNTGTNDARAPTSSHENAFSGDETNVNETTPLIGGQESSFGATPQGPGRLSLGLSEASKSRVKYAVLFSIPLLLFVPALVFFVMTLNLRSQLPPSESLEIIANLTHSVENLSSSLSTCTANSTRLANSLHEEEQRVEVCRESERRLAARVGVIQEMLDKCESDELVLKDQLREVSSNLTTCGAEKEELKRQMESGVFVQFLDLVGKMGTGGDSWVCSDATPSWSHGYTTTDSPHPTITIESWSGDLDDVQHSSAPLVFPPPSESKQLIDTSLQTLTNQQIRTSNSEQNTRLLNGAVQG